jgi:type I restriction enzyme S subunit
VIDTAFFLEPIDHDLLDKRWAYYALRTVDFKRLDTGAALPSLSRDQFYSVEVALPPLDTQRRIAGILGAYDDLIEVNRRRVAVLEGQARGLFEEWFVRFRFPGHEHHPLQDTPHGPLPQGWEWVPFTDMADVLSGGTPKKDIPDFWDGSIPFFTPRDAPKSAWALDTISQITPLGLSKCNSQLYAPGTVFITARGTVGKVSMAGSPMAMNQSCYALVGKSYPQSFIFQLAWTATQRLQTMSNGAVFDTIIVDTFRRLMVPKPPRELAAAFDRIASPMLLASLAICKSISKLETARDLLLPRLISGQLDLAAATRELETAA